MTTLLGSSAMVIQYGISGSYWYAVGGGIQLVLFAYLTFAMKLRAPGILRTLINGCENFCTESRLTSLDITMLAVVSNFNLRCKNSSAIHKDPVWYCKYIFKLNKHITISKC